MSNARSWFENRKYFMDLASSAQVSTKFAPATSATLISIIHSLEKVDVHHRPCDATIPESAVAESLPILEPGVKLSGHFWPDLKEQLFALPADEAWVHPDLDCPVCREKMAFVGAYTLDGGLTTTSAHALEVLHSHGMEAASVLPCGHVVGRECLDQILASPLHSRCPFCKASLLYGCDAALETLPAPMDLVQLRRFPAVVVPEGGWAPRRCYACEFDDWRVQWAENVLLLLCVLCSDLVRPLMTASNFVQRAGRKKIKSVKQKNLDKLSARYAAYRETSLKKLEDLMAAAQANLRHVEEGTGMTWALNLWA
ncbi:predicted protein [Verticillium alfalfae VaMs.102]|uniref:Predicted protein n=1 Tax=Verticillium alfalfae (strain VaMs.102 / ATCC MYA-4576 / FGSC 10136) TaxID=526221 RepID=C9SES1_VERA1|nr:predicted protein [Verticillium alfalfae VaMs.102]EEY16664.1 predicted protein [Verticillium alfalfae VaMs.102]